MCRREFLKVLGLFGAALHTGCGKKEEKEEEVPLPPGRMPPLPPKKPPDKSK